MIEASEGVREFLLAFADDEHLMGQQHTEWIGVAPFLEEDLAFSSIGQDELGHAALLYELLAGSTDAEIDELAYLRPAEEYRSAWLTEYSTDDWAEALVRHWLYDSIEAIRWDLVAGSSIPELADVAARAQREEAFHLRHAEALLDALLTDDDAGARLRTAAAHLLPMALGVFEGVAGEAEAVAQGVAAAPLSDHRDGWLQTVTDRFGPVDGADQAAPPDQAQRTARSADFGPRMTTMRQVFDFDPEAVW